jgi:hypothetical protein
LAVDVDNSEILLCDEQVMGPAVFKVCPAEQVPVMVNGSHEARMQKKKTSRSTGCVAVEDQLL